MRGEISQDPFTLSKKHRLLMREQNQLVEKGRLLIRVKLEDNNSLMGICENSLNLRWRLNTISGEFIDFVSFFY